MLYRMRTVGTKSTRTTHVGSPTARCQFPGATKRALGVFTWSLNIKISINLINGQQLWTEKKARAELEKKLDSF